MSEPDAPEPEPESPEPEPEPYDGTDAGEAADTADPDAPDDAGTPDGADDAAESDGPAEEDPGPDLYALREQLTYPDDTYAEQVRERGAFLDHGLGRLEQAVGWFASVQGLCPPRDFQRVRVVLLAGDHGIVQAGVAGTDPVPTTETARAILAGEATVNVLAELAGAGIRVEDIAVDGDLQPEMSRYKVRRGSERLDRTDALTEEETKAALRAGIAIADDEIDSGADLLIADAIGTGVGVPAAVLVGTSLSREPTSVVARGTDDQAWMRSIMAVRDGLRRGRQHRYDGETLLACSGGADLAALTGLLLQAALRHTPVLLDGPASLAAAIIARDIAYDSASWWYAGNRSTNPTDREALDSLDVTPILDLDITLGHGAGALMAVPVLRQAIRAIAATPEPPHEEPEPEPEEPEPELETEPEPEPETEPEPEPEPAAPGGPEPEDLPDVPDQAGEPEQ